MREVRLTLCSETMVYEEDVGTARCRLTASLQKALGVGLQSIIVVRLWSQGHNEEERQFFDVLCVAYPDSHQILDEEEICIDNSVSISSQNRIQSLSPRCLILSVHPQVNCSAIYVTPEDVAPLSLIGLPVSDDCVIVPNELCGRKGEVRVNRLNVPVQRRSESGLRKVGLVSVSTVIINNMPSMTKYKDSDATGGDSDSCHTMAVNEIIRKVVKPLESLPRCALTSGVLLLGPAGVGKTSAIRAVKKICVEWCSIHIHEVSIPDILANDDPEGKLVSLLAEVETPVPLAPDSTEQPVPLTTSSPPPPSPITYRSPDKASPPREPSTPFSFLSPSSPAAPSQAKSEAGLESEAKMTPMLQLQVLFLDEVDALGSPASQSEVQRVVTHTLCSWFDRHHMTGSLGPPACVIATSNRSEGVSPLLRRGGRLELEINITSSRDDRLSITRHLLKQAALTHSLAGDAEDVEGVVKHVADRTGGYVAADIVALVTKAVELREEGGDSAGSSWHRCFDLAMNAVPPSCLRGVALSSPSIGYDDVVGNDDVKQSLKRVLRFFSPEMGPRMAAFGLKMPGGVLLHGPPGNSKTRLVMAAASHHHLPVISLSAADVFSPYVGDSEAEVRKAFSVARQAAPCVLFFDELDAFVTNRDGGAGSGSSSVEARVLATLLTEMDGIGYNEDRNSAISGSNNGAGASGVAVMAATNRLGAIDAALLRKGRFHHVLHVPPPDEQTRSLLLQYFAGKCRLEPEEVESVRLKLKDGQCGADVENLCREARLERIRSQVQKDVC